MMTIENENNGDIVPDRSSNNGSIMKKIQQILTFFIPITDETGSRKSVAAGLSTIFVVGTGIGLLTPKNPALTPPYQSISAAIGYIYFLSWSISFYPQVMSNFQRRSTVGLSADFCVLNVLGFSCYTAYNASFFWSATIKELQAAVWTRRRNYSTVQRCCICYSCFNPIFNHIMSNSVLW